MVNSIRRVAAKIPAYLSGINIDRALQELNRRFVGMPVHYNVVLSTFKAVSKDRTVMAMEECNLFAVQYQFSKIPCKVDIRLFQ